MLTRVTAVNYRGHRQIELETGAVTVLFGTNGSGKSSLLDAINLLGRVATDGSVSMAGPFSIEGQSHDPSRDGFELAASVQGPDEELVAWSVGFDVNGRTESLQVHGDSILANPAAGTLREAAEVETSQGMTRRSSAPVLVQETLRNARRYSIRPGAAADACERDWTWILPNGGRLPAALATLREEDERAWEWLRHEFSQLFPEVADITVAPYGHKRVAISFQLQDGTELNGAYLSAGQACGLVLLFLACSPRTPAIVMLDEPESQLTPVCQQDVLSAMVRGRDEFAPSRQLLLTTHSPYVMKWAIHRDATVQFVSGDGAQDWQDLLHAQGLAPESLHTEDRPITTADCVRILETVFSGT